MFDITFKRLVTVEVLHDYYQSGQSPDLEFIPTAESRRLLAGLKLRFISTGHGFFIGMQSAEALTGGAFRPYLAPTEPFKLSFYVGLKNPHWYTISQLTDTKPSGSAFYLTNRFDKQLAGTPPLLLLTGHTGGDDRVSGNDLVRVVGGKFKYRLSQPAAVVSITASFSPVPDVLWPTPESPQGDGLEIECDLSAYPNGRYHLEEDNGFSVELYKDDAAQAFQAFGMVELFSDSPVPAYQFLEDTGGGNIIAHPAVYSIRFLARPSRWRYFVVAQSQGVDVGDFSITNASPTDFNSVTVPDSVAQKYGAGNVALWESNFLIPFRERPDTTVNYQYNPPGPGNATGRLGFPPLASAGPRRDNSGSLITDGSGAPVFFMEDYVIL
ncbi:MAG: hypothetical protein KDC66_13935 [Phaeodactylibacter sp.]|nr:hypothetical protein [Phaeodactylibacter sp.]MCB9274947.1 hypothetical protein [Lewinellaceae bacterium]